MLSSIPERKELQCHDNKWLSVDFEGSTCTHLVRANLGSACWRLCKIHTGLSTTGLGEGACKGFRCPNCRIELLHFTVSGQARCS